jgi:hypothetical protein
MDFPEKYSEPWQTVVCPWRLVVPSPEPNKRCTKSARPPFGVPRSTESGCSSDQNRDGRDRSSCRGRRKVFFELGDEFTLLFKIFFGADLADGGVHVFHDLCIGQGAQGAQPSTSRFSSPGTSANSFPPSTISLIAWSKGMVTHLFSPRLPARLSTCLMRKGS